MKTASYAGVIVFGLGTTAAILYALYKEVLSGESPTGLYQVSGLNVFYAFTPWLDALYIGLESCGQVHGSREGAGPVGGAHQGVRRGEQEGTQEQGRVSDSSKMLIDRCQFFISSDTSTTLTSRAGAGSASSSTFRASGRGARRSSTPEK